MEHTIGRLIVSLVFYFAGQFAIAGESWEMPRTEYGQPDFQGVWFYGTATPLERPVELGLRQVYSAEEAELLLNTLIRADEIKSQPLSRDLALPEAGAPIAQEADHNMAISRTNLVRIDGHYRTSQIISPADGRLPYRVGGQDIFAIWQSQGHGAFDGPEIRPVSERCAGPNGGPAAPMVSWFYNANMQIVQTRDHVMLLSEMNHDARIIPLTRPDQETGFPQWMGSSVGTWEGDTLVVETQNFRPDQSWFAFVMSDQLHVVERFTLIGADEILYSYTMTDAKIYTEAVTVEKTIVRREPGEQLFEYACHEGNYSLPSILAGARRQEMDARASVR